MAFPASRKGIFTSSTPPATEASSAINGVRDPHLEGSAIGSGVMMRRKKLTGPQSPNDNGGERPP